LFQRGEWGVDHSLVVGCPSLRESHVETRSGFVEVEVLVEGDDTATGR
jgi:hypothetical protein